MEMKKIICFSRQPKQNCHVDDDDVIDRVMCQI